MVQAHSTTLYSCPFDHLTRARQVINHIVMDTLTLRELLPFLIPIVLLQLALMLFALIDLARRPKANGPKWVWAIIIIGFNLIGPIAYFLVGRQEE